MLLIVHKRKSAHPSGTVTDANGTVLGAVRRQSRIAAGTHGQRRTFYSARVCVPGSPDDYSYIGTRYVTRAQAVAAIRDFHGYAPLRAIESLAMSLPEPPRYWYPWTLQRAMRSALHTFVRDWELNRRALHPFNVYPAKAAA